LATKDHGSFRAEAHFEFVRGRGYRAGICDRAGGFFQTKLAQRGFGIVDVDVGAETVIRYFAAGLDAASVTLQDAASPGRGTTVTIRLVYTKE